MSSVIEYIREDDLLDLDGPELVFWPTRRDAGLPALPPPILVCQRCGQDVLPATGWWCQWCSQVARHYQQHHCWSMVQVAAMGELEPSWASLLQDLPPWMVPARLELPFARPEEIARQKVVAYRWRKSPGKTQRGKRRRENWWKVLSELENRT